MNFVYLSYSLSIAGRGGQRLSMWIIYLRNPVTPTVGGRVIPHSGG